MRALFFVALLACVAHPASADPKTDYLLYCRGCHLADGTSVPPEVPTLVNEVGKLLSVPGGREYIVRVPGVSQADLDDEDLAAVLNWVLREFNSATLPPDFQPYSAEYVRNARKKVLADPLRYRAELLGTE